MNKRLYLCLQTWSVLRSMLLTLCEKNTFLRSVYVVTDEPLYLTTVTQIDEVYSMGGLHLGGPIPDFQASACMSL